MINKYGGEFAMEWMTKNKEWSHKLNYNFDIALLTIEIKSPEEKERFDSWMSTYQTKLRSMNIKKWDLSFTGNKMRLTGYP